VVGGRAISIEEAPWQVAVVAIDSVEGGGKISTLCGGAILSEREILTSAECMYDFYEMTPARVPTEDLFVTAGQSQFKASEAETKGVHVNEVRIHPYYEINTSGASADDLALLKLETPLTVGSTEKAISLVSTGTLLSEGTGVSVAAYGQESFPSEPNGDLNSLGMTLTFPRRCGGEADALFLCAAAAGGSVCFSDFGAGLELPGSPTQLAGITVDLQQTEEGPCSDGAVGFFANLAAPEIRDWIDGDNAPPHAPRGGGVAIRGATTVGHALTCEPGTWSYSPSITYEFIDSGTGQVLQQGPSSTYTLTTTDVGATISCEVLATNAGGTAFARTGALAPITAAPSSVRPPPSPPTSTVPASSPPASGTPSAPAVAGEPGSVTLAALKIAVNRGAALVRLHCQGHATCAGKLTLTATEAVKHKGRKRSRFVTVGSASFSIAGEATRSVNVALSSAGLRLFAEAHGLLSASVTLNQRKPVPPATRRTSVELVLSQTHGEKRRGRK
jgi:Trypsin